MKVNSRHKLLGIKLEYNLSVRIEVLKTLNFKKITILFFILLGRTFFVLVIAERARHTC